MKLPYSVCLKDSAVYISVHILVQLAIVCLTTQ